MRKVLTIAAAAALSAALAGSGEEPRWGEGSTRLVVESSKLDLGTVSAGEQAVATFQLRNPSDRDVRILAVRPS